MTGSRRTLVVLVVAVLALGGLSAYLVLQRRDLTTAAAAAQAREATTPRLDAATVAGRPHLVVRSTEAGPTYGHVALLPLTDLSGPRAVLDLTCARVAAVADGGLCLHEESGLVTDHRALLLDATLQPVADLPLAGLPSRARASRDGAYAASTVFVTGHAYTDAGFSTETLVYDMAQRRSLGNLEDWTTIRDGRRFTAEDRNYWGVSFVGDGPQFYATLGTGGQTELVRGDATTQTLTVVRENGACPSVSPDGTRIVFKQRDGAGDFPLVVWDLARDTVTPLAETRPVDDQVTWLDADTVAYGLGRGLSSFIDFDVWSVSLTGGPPEIIVRDASSPTVVSSRP